MISVIVPFLNEEKYLERCIQALLTQDYSRKQYELLFVDNGSTDDSISIVRKYPGVTLLNEDIPNVYAARNQALRQARGDVIAFTDGDCVVNPQWLKAIDHSIQKGYEIVLGARYFSKKASKGLKVFERYENSKMKYLTQYCHPRYYYGYTNNMAVKDSVFKRLGSFEEIPVSADTEFVQRYAAQSEHPRVGFEPNMTIEHLEVKQLGTWLNKIKLYGRYNRFVADWTRYRFLSPVMKWRIARHCCREHGLGFLESLELYGLLMLGNLYYQTGDCQRRLGVTHEQSSIRYQSV